MQTSLSHLSEKKQFEIKHITEMIREVLQPEMVVLFGSHAKGRQVEHKYHGKDGTLYEYISDYDFLVVVNKVTEETSDLEWAIEERAEIYEPPVNLEIHEAAYINKGLETGQYFFADIVKEGILLHDTGNVRLTEPRELTPVEQRAIAEDYFNVWFAQANEFIIDGQNAYNRGSYKKALFELHQATEGLYYCALLVFTGYKPKTHNLKKLRRKAKHISQDLFVIFMIETDKHEKELFEKLKSGYIDARYKSNYHVSNQEVSDLLKRILQMKDLVEKICKGHIDGLQS